MDEKYIDNLGMSPYIDEGLWDKWKARAAGYSQAAKNIATSGTTPQQSAQFNSLFKTFSAKSVKTLSDFIKVMHPYWIANKLTSEERKQIDVMNDLKLTLVNLKLDPVTEANIFTRPFSTLGAQASGMASNIIKAYQKILKGYFDAFSRDVKALGMDPVQVLRKSQPDLYPKIQQAFGMPAVSSVAPTTLPAPTPAPTSVPSTPTSAVPKPPTKSAIPPLLKQLFDDKLIGHYQLDDVFDEYIKTGVPVEEILVKLRILDMDYLQNNYPDLLDPKNKPVPTSTPSVPAPPSPVAPAGSTTPPSSPVAPVTPTPGASSSTPAGTPPEGKTLPSMKVTTTGNMIYSLTTQTINKLIVTLQEGRDMLERIKSEGRRMRNKTIVEFDIDNPPVKAEKNGLVYKWALRYRYNKSNDSHCFDIALRTTDPRGQTDKAKMWTPFVEYTDFDVIDDEDLGEIKPGFDVLATIKNTNPELGNILEQSMAKENETIDSSVNQEIANVFANVATVMDPESVERNVRAGKETRDDEDAPDKLGGSGKGETPSAPPAAPETPAPAKPEEEPAPEKAARTHTPGITAKPIKPKAKTPVKKPITTKKVPAKKPATVKGKRSVTEKFSPNFKDFFPL